MNKFNGALGYSITSGADKIAYRYGNRGQLLRHNFAQIFRILINSGIHHGEIQFPSTVKFN